MKFAHFLVACVALTAPVAAIAADETAPAVGATAPSAKPAKDPNRVICKSEAEPGSLIATKKTCLTVAQWKERAFNAGQWAEHQSTYNSQPNGR